MPASRGGWSAHRAAAGRFTCQFTCEEKPFAPAAGEMLGLLSKSVKPTCVSVIAAWVSQLVILHGLLGERGHRYVVTVRSGGETIVLREIADARAAPQRACAASAHRGRRVISRGLILPEPFGRSGPGVRRHVSRGRDALNKGRGQNAGSVLTLRSNVICPLAGRSSCWIDSRLFNLRFIKRKPINKLALTSQGRDPNRHGASGSITFPTALVSLVFGSRILIW